MSKKRTRNKAEVVLDIDPATKIKENSKQPVAETNDQNQEEEAQRQLQIDYYDSSDEEDLRNTIGNIPVQWYEEYGHVGYELSGQRIPKNDDGSDNKKEGGRQGEIDAFLQREEDPDHWRKVFDAQTGSDMVLNREQVQKLEAIAKCNFPQIGYNPYQPFFDLFSSKREIHPISNRPPDKRSFVPSEDERRIVGRMVHAIKMGWMKRRDQLEKERADREDREEHLEAYDLWATEDTEEEQLKSKSALGRLKMHWPAPKVRLPGNAESYRPLPEYLFTEEEKRKWEETEPESRRPDFLPQSYDSLRKVPFYDGFYEERLERCMDLHLAPRQRKMRLKVDPAMLLPDLPNPEDLQPFPTMLAFYMRGHKGEIRSISMEPEFGELLVSGGADSTVRVWALPNGNCLRQYRMPAPVTYVQYTPDPSKTLVLVSCEADLLTILNISTGDRLAVSHTRQFLLGLPVEAAPENSAGIRWFRQAEKGGNKTAMDAIQLQMKDKIRTLAWHRKGDYFATVNFESQSAESVIIHQLSKCQSQKPFTKGKGFVQSILFHPTKPWFFVGTRQHVLIYDLAQGELKRKVFAGTKWLSCMALHPAGDNLFIGGLDRAFAWLDLELGTKPWKKLRNHQSAIRSVAYHRRYPLLATVSDDATAIVYHARVSQDLSKENLLVPVKRLFGHKVLAKRQLKQLKMEKAVTEREAMDKAKDNKNTNIKAIDEANDDDDEGPLNGDEGEEAADGEMAPSAAGELANDRLAILCALFHPSQPWLLTSGADGQIALFTY